MCVQNIFVYVFQKFLETNKTCGMGCALFSGRSVGVGNVCVGKREKRKNQNKDTDAARSGQIWGPISQIWLVFQMSRSCFQIWPDLARSGNLGKSFFQKKIKTPQIWPDLEIWPVFFFLRFLAIVSQGKGLSNFFFRPYIGLISTI